MRTKTMLNKSFNNDDVLFLSRFQHRYHQHKREILLYPTQKAFRLLKDYITHLLTSVLIDENEMINSLKFCNES